MSNKLTISQALEKLEANETKYSLSVRPDKDYLISPRIFTTTGVETYLSHGGIFKGDQINGDIEQTSMNEKALLKTAGDGGLRRDWLITMLPSNLWKYWQPYESEEIYTDALRIDTLLKDRNIKTAEELEVIIREQLADIHDIELPLSDEAEPSDKDQSENDSD